MDILNRIEIKLDALLKCWSIQQGDTEKVLFEVVDELIKQQESKEEKIITIEQLYKESKEIPGYIESLKTVIVKYFEQGKKPPIDGKGFFTDEFGRVFNIRDNE
jgi:hypothetical protein